ncbi:hypothetical protein LB533_02870 [Mesorhizobium sp. BR1-1-13]|nr:hypothetical protein [Mesorhizobium sp. BR1-1-13]MBZ9940042.1 hypothetical protein [Mesorhizobium sp. BR1-1-13]
MASPTGTPTIYGRGKGGAGAEIPRRIWRLWRFKRDHRLGSSATATASDREREFTLQPPERQIHASDGLEFKNMFRLFAFKYSKLIDIETWRRR